MTKAKVIAINTSKIRAKIRLVIVFGMTLIAMLVALSAHGFGQSYQSLSINETFTGADGATKIKEANAEIKAAEDTGSYGTQGEAYMLEYWLPRMTQTDRKTLSSLGKFRSLFLKKFLAKRMSTAGRKRVISKLLPELNEIAANKNFHPAVRVNAVTMMGMLYDNQTEKWPFPSPAAYGALKKIMSSSASEDFLKVAAISGIANFAEISRQGARTSVPGQDIKAQLAGIIRGNADGQDKWSDDLNYWMKRRAAQILGQIGSSDTAAVSTQVMKGKDLKVTRDDFWLRYDGLDALRSLDFKADLRGKAPQMINDVLEFVAYSLERESSFIKKQVEDLVYTNILWNDLDLNQGKRRSSRQRGGSRGGRGGRGPGREEGGGELGDGDLTGSNGGRGGGGTQDDDAPRGPTMKKSDTVELPIFILNDSRGRAKAVLLSARDFLKVKTTGGIHKIADEDTQKRIDERILPVIEELLADTELGVIDYRKLKDNLPDTEDVTQRLEKIYNNGAETIRELLPKAAGGAADAATTVDEDVFQ